MNEQYNYTATWSLGLMKALFVPLEYYKDLQNSLMKIARGYNLTGTITTGGCTFEFDLHGSKENCEKFGKELDLIRAIVR